jgi:hypothetical protein
LTLTRPVDHAEGNRVHWSYYAWHQSGCQTGRSADRGSPSLSARVVA